MSIVSYILNGISLGSVYAIIALGYTMVYGIAKMLNFAHGDIIMVGSYVAFISINSMGLPVPVSILLSVVVCTVLGMVIERVAYKPLRHASKLAVLITAIGASYFLQNVALLIFGANTIFHFHRRKWFCSTGRRSTFGYYGDDCYGDCLRRNHDRLDGIYEIFQSRSCNAGRI